MVASTIGGAGIGTDACRGIGRLGALVCGGIITPTFPNICCWNSPQVNKCQTTLLVTRVCSLDRRTLH